MIINKIINYADYLPRKVLNTVDYMFSKRKTNRFCKSIIECKNPAEMYCAISDSFMKKKDVICNFEDTHFQKVMGSNCPTIFVMNHSKQMSDAKLMTVFNTLLNAHYALRGRAIPSAKILMNENIIKSQPKVMREVFEKIGAVGINIFSSTSGNIRKFLGLINSYIHGNSNIFIFPEGKNCCKDNLLFSERFQDGVSKMVECITKSGKTAKVVPLGFTYGDNKSVLGSIYLGKPLYFKKCGEKLLTNGNTLEEVKGISDISKRIIRSMEESIEQSEVQYAKPNEIRL